MFSENIKLTQINCRRLKESKTFRNLLQIQLFETEDCLQLMRVISSDERFKGFLAGLIQEVILGY